MKKKLYLIFLMLAFILTSCKKSGVKEEKTQYISSGSLINIYIINDDKKGIHAKEEQYQLKQPDSVSSSIEEIVVCAKNDLPEGIEYSNFIVDENNNVEFDFLLTEATKEELVLFDAALTQTIYQVKDVGNVTVDFRDENGETVRRNTYTNDSFFYYGDSEDMPVNLRRIVVYIPNEKGKLSRNVNSVNISFDESSEEYIIDFLANEKVIPSETKVNNSSIVGKICYLDLNDRFTKSREGVDSDIAVYAIVNSITSIEGIEYVQITVNGKVVENYGGVDISEPLSFNLEK